MIFKKMKLNDFIHFNSMSIKYTLSKKKYLTFSAGFRKVFL